MSSLQTREFFEGVLGEAGRETNVLFEKALASNQKNAMSNWIWRNIGGHKPLYANITLDQSKTMLEAGVTAKGLKAMTPEERLTELGRYVGSKEAKLLNERFEKALKSGQLGNWEERTLGTKEMHADKKLKGAFSKLEALNETGLLTPDDTERFMADLVASKLGVEVTPEQSEQISKLSKEVSTAIDKITATGDWTAKNADNVYDYFLKRYKLESYVKGLGQSDITDSANDLIAIARNNLLGSPRIARNSAIYQIIPSLERFFTKRIVSAGVGNMDYSLIDQISAKVSSGLKVDKEGAGFIKDHLKMVLKIYNKTGYDISRMTDLHKEGPTFIGEYEKVIGERPIGEAKGFINKTRAITSKIAKATGVFPKWFAGGTDTIVAATTRAETSVLWSKEIARLEAKKGKLPSGMTEKQRADQLLVESLSFDTKDPVAEKIRIMGVEDANFSNNTQPDGLADFVVKARDTMGIGKVKFGRLLVPFAKISTTAISRGLQTAIPVGVVKDLRGMYFATKEPDLGIRERTIAKHVASLVGFLGMMGTAILITSMLEDDDYAPPWAISRGKEYDEIRAKGASAGSIRIGGKWIPLRYLPIVGIPISAIMNARRVRSRGGNPVAGYLQGVAAQVIDLPLITDVGNLYQKLDRAVSSGETVKILDSAGFDGKSVLDWAKVRAIPSFLSYDVYNAVFSPDLKVDFLGREIDRGGVFSDDKTNDLLIEFSRLDREGYGPTISEYTGKWKDEAIKKVGEDTYNKKLTEFKQEYHKRVEKLMSQSNYDRMKSEQKQKAINKIRDQEIIRQVEILAKQR